MRDEQVASATIETITLEKIKFGIRNVMSGSLRAEMKIDSDYDILSGDLTCQITAYLIGNKVHSQEVDSVVNRYPSTIWDLAKLFYAPKWFKRKFPVRYSVDKTQVTHNHYHVCPHLDAPRGKHIKFLIENDISGDARW